MQQGTANVTDVCGSAPVSTLVKIGPPVVTQMLANGNPTGSNVTLSSASGTISVITDNATNCTWTMNGGSGSYSPYGPIPSPSFTYNCNVVTSTFMRMFASPSNPCGSVASATFFYVRGAGYTGYRLPYPNPTSDELSIDCDDAQYAEDLLESISLVDDKANKALNFDVSKVKTSSFKESKQVKFDVKKLKKGTYYLNVKIAGESYSNKIMIQ